MAGFFFTSDIIAKDSALIILSLWLTIIYLGIYFHYIISKIVTGDKINAPTETINPELFLYNFILLTFNI